MFSQYFIAGFMDAEQAENDGDEKGKEEFKDDDSKAYESAYHKQFALLHFQPKLNVSHVHHRLAHPPVDLEYPPPKS